MNPLRFIVLVVFITIANYSYADIYRWDTGEVIPRTAGITPGPGLQLNSWDTESRNLRYADLTGALDLSRTVFAQSWLDYARFTRANLSGTSFGLASLLGADFVNANLSDAHVSAALLANTNFTGAVIAGADLAATTSRGFTAEQLYSTRSYQDRSLPEITLSGNDLTGWDFAGQDLRGASFGGSSIAIQMRGPAADLTNADFTGANLTNADLQEAFVSGASFDGAIIIGATLWSVRGFTPSQLYSTKSYRDKDLSGIVFYGNDLSGWDFGGQDLSNVMFSAGRFGPTSVSNANFTDAIITKADLSAMATPTGGLTASQFYSTRNYGQKDLQGIRLEGNDLTGWDLSGQDLTNAQLSGSILTNAMLSGANFNGASLTNASLAGALISGADFSSTTSHGFTRAQLYSTASYHTHQLGNIGMAGNDLSTWDFSRQDLRNSIFGRPKGDNTQADVTDADFSFADLRGAILDPSGARINGAILPDGHISGLDVTSGDVYVIRDHDGNSIFGLPARSVVVDRHLGLAVEATCRLLFESDAWDSLISFEPGIPVQLGGTLDLTFADDVDVAMQVGRTLHIFDWTGVSPAGQFRVTAPLAWDLSNLYTTGEVRLVSLPGDFDGVSQLTFADISVLANAVRTENEDSKFDLTGDGAVDLSDHGYWVHAVKHTTFGDANLDARFDSGDLVQVFQAGQYEDPIDDNSTWDTGDWNADGDFTSSDLVVAIQDGGYESAPRAGAAVPEPTSIQLALLIIGCVALMRHRIQH